MRTVFKRIFFSVGFVLASPLIVLSLLEGWIRGVEKERLFCIGKEILSIIPTPIGTNMRKAFYWATCSSVHWNTNFLFGSWLAHRDNRIAPNVTIGAYTFIGYADVGENVLFGARVSVISGKYQHGRPDQRCNGGDVEGEKVIIKIGRDSWIGQDSVIMADVGENSTVGAGSVVMRDVADGITVLGNPARRVSLYSGDCVSK
jgi:virginiamycin A acetyltransferase